MEENELVRKLWNSTVAIETEKGWDLSYVGNVSDLVREICKLAEERGLTVGRWETHSRYSQWFSKSSVTWAVFKGIRPVRSSQLPSGSLVVHMGREGKTKRCEAYKKLSGLLEVLKHA